MYQIFKIRVFQAYAGISAPQRPDRSQHPEPQPSTSRGHVTAETDTSGRFVKPTLSHQSTSSSSSGSGRGMNTSHLSNQSHLPSHNGGGSRHWNMSSSSSSSSSAHPPSSTSFDGSRTSSSIHSGTEISYLYFRILHLKNKFNFLKVVEV